MKIKKLIAIMLIIVMSQALTMLGIMAEENQLRVETPQSSSAVKFGDQMPIAKAGGWIYYNYKGYNYKITRISADGKSKVAIPDNINFTANTATDKTWIYYVADGSIYKIKIDGTGKAKVLDGTDNNVYRDTLSFSKGWLYYVAADRNIYKIKPDGTGNAQIPGISGGGPIADGDWLYYRDSEDSKYYRVKPDGTGKAKVSDDEFYTTPKIVNGTLYYVDGKTLWSVSGGKKTQIFKSDDYGNGIRDFAVSGNTVYFAANNMIQSIASNGKGKAKTIATCSTSFNGGDADISNMIVDGKWVYFLENYLTYKVGIDGKAKKTQIVKGTLYNFGVINGMVFYEDKNVRTELARMSEDGKTKKVLMNKEVSDASIYKDSIYYLLPVSSGGYFPTITNYLHKAKSDGTGEKKLLKDEVSSYQIYNDLIIYRNQSTLYKAKLDGSGAAKIAEGFSSYQLSGDCVFYITYDYKLMKYDLKKNTAQTVVDKITQGIYFDKNNVYYMKSADKKVYRTNIATNAAEEISEPAVNFSVDGAWLYYLIYDRGTVTLNAKNLENGKKAAIQVNSSYYELDNISYLNGYFYYIKDDDSKQLYKVSEDGTTENTAIITEAVGSIRCIDNSLYALTDTKIYIIGNTVQEVAKPEGVYFYLGNVSVNGGYLYFSSSVPNSPGESKGIIRLNLKTMKTDTL